MDQKHEMALIGERLKAARALADLQQDQVADFLNELGVGVKRPTISNWESGRNLPCLVQFRELCTMYGIPPYKILWGASPISLTREEAKELADAVKPCSPSVQRKMTVVLALLTATDEDHAAA